MSVSPDWKRLGVSACGQILHLPSDDSKAFPGSTGAGRFYRGIESEQIGLRGDAADHLRDLTDVANGIGQFGEYITERFRRGSSGRAREVCLPSRGSLNVKHFAFS